MIIPLYPHQPELRLRLSQPGPGGRRLADAAGVRLVIRDPETSGDYPWSPIYFSGPWPGHDPAVEGRERPGGNRGHPALVYPGFDLTDEGDLVFRLDKLLWRRPPGRYRGTVESVEGCVLAELDLDLWGSGVELERVELLEKDC